MRVLEIDLDNMLATLTGKGRKQRTVPFYFELRKVLFRYIGEFARKADARFRCVHGLTHNYPSDDVILFPSAGMQATEAEIRKNRNYRHHALG